MAASEILFLKLLLLLIEIPASVRNMDPTFGAPIFFPMRQMFERLRQGRGGDEIKPGGCQLFALPVRFPRKIIHLPSEREFASGVYGALM